MMQNTPQKRVMAVHDISCFGRCSLTVALPILSAAGLETSVIPTAVLSTHTGGFTGYTCRDLTDDILPIAKHWKSLGLRFDAIYTGYLGSTRQLSLVSELIDDFRTEDSTVLVDPVMADHGKMYVHFDPAFAAGMAKLCAKADIVVPNMTEAAFLLGETYHPGPHPREYVAGLLGRLCALGPKQAVVTGVLTDGGELGAACLDTRTGALHFAFQEKIEGFYHGTGDVFGSALLAALMNGRPLPKAAETAVRFTQRAIARTKAAGTDLRFGVDFEAELPALIKDLGIK